MNFVNSNWYKVFSAILYLILGVRLAWFSEDVSKSVLVVLGVVFLIIGTDKIIDAIKMNIKNKAVEN